MTYRNLSRKQMERRLEALERADEDRRMLDYADIAEKEGRIDDANWLRKMVVIMNWRGLG